MAKLQCCIVNRKEIIDLLCRCNEIGTMGGFIKITLNDEDPVVVTSSIF